MDAAFIFGTTGNLSAALGAGWSVEDAFAWAVGSESELTLPLPGNHLPCVLRFDVHPVVFPPKVLRQRLMVRVGKTVVGAFELTTRETIVVPLPVELTSSSDTLALTIIHPDAVRPRDHVPVDDSRRLALCFHSASLTQAESGPADASATAVESVLEPLHAIIAGGSVARRVCQVIGKLPSLKGKFGFRFLDLSRRFGDAAAALPPDTLETMQLCWMELNAGLPETREPLRASVPGGCTLRTFYAPIARSLWPFLGPDSRAIPEPGRYDRSRYPYGDRLAAALAGMNLPDDVLYLMYELSAEQEPLELDEMFANDLRRWRAEGKKSQMQLADFIERNFASNRLFLAPGREGSLLLRAMIGQILDDGLIRDIADPDVLSAELDAMLEGYAGWQEELPVHKRVAEHFKLTWWSADMTYRWMNNQRSHREHIIDTIRWTQWRP